MKGLQMLKFILSLMLIFSIASAKEPTNWFFGAGIGFGYAKIDKVYNDASQNKIGISWRNWTDVKPETVSDWGVNYEFLLGYKHFLNDWVGFRYFVNVGANHYKDKIFTAGEAYGTIVDYGANVDILINFWTADSWSVGMFGGVGVGGVYIESKALNTYKAMYNGKIYNNGPGDNSIYAGEGQIYQNHLNAVFDIGLRGSYFQKFRDVNKRVCNNREDGRRTCKVPVSYFEHSFEIAARFPVLEYAVTSGADFMGGYATGTVIPGSQGQYISAFQRPGYVVSNPYKITFRYIFAF